MILKNSLNFISEFFNYTSNQIRKIYLSSRIYNKKISRIDDKFIEYKPSPNLLDCLIKYEKQKAENSISYGLSSFGYDARVSDEFRIFTDVDSAVVDPKNF